MLRFGGSKNWFQKTEPNFFPTQNGGEINFKAISDDEAQPVSAPCATPRSRGLPANLQISRRSDVKR